MIEHGGQHQGSTMPPKQPAELDAEALAVMLAGPSETWVDVDLWISTHTVSARYVRERYRVAREREACGEPPTLPAPMPPASTVPAPTDEPPTDQPPMFDPATDAVGEDAFRAHVAAGLQPGDSVHGLAHRYGVSIVLVRTTLRQQHLRLPDTPGTRKWKP